MPLQSNFLSQSAASTTTAAAFGSNNILGNILVVAAGNYNGSTATTATIADTQTNTYVQADTVAGVAGEGPIYIWWVASCKAGANTVTVTWSASSAFTEIVILEYTVGPKPANVVLDSHGNNSFTTANTSLAIGPISPVTAGDLLVAYIRGGTSGGHVNLTAPVGFSLETSSSFGAFYDLASASGGSTTDTWSWSVSQSYGLGILAAINQGQAPSSQGTSYPVPFLFPGY